MSKPALTVEAVMLFNLHPETTRLRLALLEARKTAARTRAHVNSYILPLFRTFRFLRTEGGRSGEAIASPQDLYLTDLQDEQVARFYAACDAEHRRHGYHVPAPGFCPALTAEHAVILAENALLDHGGSMLGIDFRHCYGNLREDALDVLETGSKKRRARRR